MNPKHRSIIMILFSFISKVKSRTVPIELFTGEKKARLDVLLIVNLNFTQRVRIEIKMNGVSFGFALDTNEFGRKYYSHTTNTGVFLAINLKTNESLITTGIT